MPSTSPSRMIPLATEESEPCVTEEPAPTESSHLRRVKSLFITGANRGLGLEMVKQVLEKVKPDHLFATYRSKCGSDVRKMLIKLKCEAF